MPGFDDEGPSIETMSGGDPYATVHRHELASVVDALQVNMRMMSGQLNVALESAADALARSVEAPLELHAQVLNTLISQQKTLDKMMELMYNEIVFHRRVFERMGVRMPASLLEATVAARGRGEDQG